MEETMISEYARQLMEARGDSAHGFDEFAARAGRRRRSAPLVEPSTVFELQIAIEAEEVGRADRAVDAGNFLAFVVQVGKREVVTLGEFSHLREGVLRIA